MASGSFALVIQRLRPNDRVLVMGQLAGYRNGDGWFDAIQVLRLHQDLRIPDPSNVNRILGQLRSGDLVRPNGGGNSWTLTPTGSLKATELIGDFDYGKVNEHLASAGSVEFLDARYYVLPPTLAPPKWQRGIARFLERFPFEQNVFCMTRFPRLAEEDAEDPLLEVISEARSTFADYGLTLHLASDHQIEDELWGNVGAHMWACQYGIGLVEALVGGSSEANNNLLIELGSMLTMGRRCAIVKDGSVTRLPSDLSSQLYKSAHFTDPASVRSAITEWIQNDIMMGL